MKTGYKNNGYADLFLDSNNEILVAVGVNSVVERASLDE